MGDIIQDKYGRPEPAEPYKPESIEVVTGKSDGRKHLVLQVSIEGRPRKVLLTSGDIHSHGLSGPAAVEELRGIREALERIADALSQGTESRSMENRKRT